MKVTKPTKQDYNGYANHETWKVATYMSNDESLYNLCKSLYEDGYKSFGAMRCKLREYGNKWQSLATGIDYIDWRSDEIRCGEITNHLKSLYEPTKR